MSASLPAMPAEPTPEALRLWRKQAKRARRAARHQGWRGGHPLSGWRLPAMILGFVAWWPIGLALLTLFSIWRPAMSCSAAWMTPWKDRLRGALTAPGGSGNQAFDEHRAAVLRRLEEERQALDAAQAEFAAFVQQLRRAKDQEEFDRFMAARGGR